MGSNPFMMAGRMTTATANAMETAAGNEAGAVNGFMGMGMVGGMGQGGGFEAAQSLYNVGVQQVSNQQTQASGDSWKCSCGATVSGSFCSQCGAKKPTDDTWTCSCGATNKGNFCSNCGSKKPDNAVSRCANCGWTSEAGQPVAKFCPNCGSKMS